MKPVAESGQTNISLTRFLLTMVFSLFFSFVLEYAIRRVQLNQDGLKLNGTCRFLIYADNVNICHVISGSLSPRHGASSGCGWRNDFQYGGQLRREVEKTI
jgi:hypothetical protein